jgi:hypothetical protein
MLPSVLESVLFSLSMARADLWFANVAAYIRPIAKPFSLSLAMASTALEISPARRLS